MAVTTREIAGAVVAHMQHGCATGNRAEHQSQRKGPDAIVTTPAIGMSASSVARLLVVGSDLLLTAGKLQRAGLNYLHHANPKRLIEDEETGEQRYKYVRTGPDHFSLALTDDCLAATRHRHISAVCDVFPETETLEWTLRW